MRWLWRIAPTLAAAFLLLTGPVHAVPGDPIIIFETAEAGVTQYSVLNQSTNSVQPFAVTAFLVTTTAGVVPATANPDWTAQALTDIDWNFPKGGVGSGLPTWAQYTGVFRFRDATGGAPFANAYFNNFTYDSGLGLVSLPQDPIAPTDPIRGGFSFTGAPSSTFLAVGPADWTQPFALGAVASFGGWRPCPNPAA